MTEKLKEFFKKDYFATSLLGIEIVKAEDGYCECTLDKRKELLNANGVMQGGALYTLGDFCFAVASASTGKMAVTSNVTVSYVKPGKGESFKAIAKPVNLGRNLYYYDVEIFDGEILVTKLSVVGFVVGETANFIK